MADPILRVRLVAPADALVALIKSSRHDLGCGAPRVSPDGTAAVDAYITEKDRERLAKEHPRVKQTVLGDATAIGKERQAEVGKGDRFQGGKVRPRGVGKKVPR
jgi:hypothetical protein